MKAVNILIFLTASLLNGAILYLEDFTNVASGTNFNTGWNLDSADPLVAQIIVDGAGLRHETWSQSTIPATAVNNSPVVPGAGETLGDYGSPFTPFNGGTSRFAYTLEVAALGLTVDDIKTFQMDLRKNENANKVWFGIMVENVWYFSRNTLVPIIDDGYYRFRVPAGNYIEIDQVFNGTDGWNVGRNPFGTNVVGPADFDGTEIVEGFAMLFLSPFSMTGNMYIDNLALTDETVPEEYLSPLVIEVPGGTAVEVAFASVPGVRYQLEVSTDGMQTWAFSGDPVEASSSVLTVPAGSPPAVGEKAFYRISVASYPIAP